MRHHNTVMHDLLKRIPWETFSRLVEEHGADARTRTLSCKNHLVAMLYAQLAGATSLREVTAGLESHAARLYHLGAAPVHRSTLADANTTRPADIFTGLFAALVSQARTGLRRTVQDGIRLIDSTSIRLSSLSADWARFSATACSAKVHIVYDPDAAQPIHAVVTAGRVNDISAAKAMPIEPGQTYVFDLGYYDYGWWARLDHADCRIVTRFKSNTPLRLIETLPIPADSAILSDRIGWLPERLKTTRLNPLQTAVREVIVRIDTGRTLRLLSNDLDAPAHEIADLYKRRWDIELFFRWIKQTLKIAKFLGRSENAVRIQVATALIAYLLLQLAHQSQTAIAGLLTFAKLVRCNLMHRRRIDRLLEPHPAIEQTRPNSNWHSHETRTGQPWARPGDPWRRTPNASKRSARCPGLPGQ